MWMIYLNKILAETLREEHQLVELKRILIIRAMILIFKIIKMNQGTLEIAKMETVEVVEMEVQDSEPINSTQ